MPPIWIASAAVGSCLQSENMRKYPDGFRIRQLSAIHIAHHRAQLWPSLPSPTKLGRPLGLFSYFLDVICCFELMERPPEQYGGSVITASTELSGSFPITSRQSPSMIRFIYCSIILPFSPCSCYNDASTNSRAQLRAVSLLRLAPVCSTPGLFLCHFIGHLNAAAPPRNTATICHAVIRFFNFFSVRSCSFSFFRNSARVFCKDRFAFAIKLLALSDRV